MYSLVYYVYVYISTYVLRVQSVNSSISVEELAKKNKEEKALE